MRKYPAKIRRCVDGDTVDADIDLGFYMQARIRLRLAGFDTPERGANGFHEAREALNDLIHQGQDEEGWIDVETYKTGKYGRWLAWLWPRSFEGEELSINVKMIEWLEESDF